MFLRNTQMHRSLRLLAEFVKGEFQAVADAFGQHINGMAKGCRANKIYGRRFRFLLHGAYDIIPLSDVADQSIEQGIKVGRRRSGNSAEVLAPIACTRWLAKIEHQKRTP